MLSSYKYKTERPLSKPPFRDSEPKSKLTLAELHEILEAQNEDYDADDPKDCKTGEQTQLVNFS